VTFSARARRRLDESAAPLAVTGVVIVKLGYLFPELRDAAPREILAMTPGYNDMDLTWLPWRYQTRPIFPLDPIWPGDR
jgi:microcystin degradation protein MlrC